MMKAILSKLFTAFVEYLTGQKQENFQKIVGWVLDAEQRYNEGGLKAKWVREQIREVLKVTTPWIVNLLLELAVAYATKQGLINKSRE